jgi:hypothetical protein
MFSTQKAVWDGLVPVESWCGCLGALFALACQLVLSFGHIHAGQFGGGSIVWAVAESGDGSADGPPSSPEKNPIGLAGDFCAICASINLAGTLILPILAIILAPRLISNALGLDWKLCDGPADALCIGAPRSRAG